MGIQLPKYCGFSRGGKAMGIKSSNYCRFNRSAVATRGFTILELILVIVLIAAASTITLGLLGVGRSGSQLRGAARTIATELRYTRAQALITGKPQRFEMDLDKHSWAAPGNHRGTLPQWLQVRFDGVRQEQRSARDAAIRFFPDGSATGGRISLLTQGAGWRVDVRWLTGEVSMTRLQDVSP
jgi:general secretion pathway protein H